MLLLVVLLLVVLLRELVVLALVLHFQNMTYPHVTNESTPAGWLLSSERAEALVERAGLRFRWQAQAILPPVAPAAVAAAIAAAAESDTDRVIEDDAAIALPAPTAVLVCPAGGALLEELTPKRAQQVQTRDSKPATPPPSRSWYRSWYRSSTVSTAPTPNAVTETSALRSSLAKQPGSTYATP